MKTVINSAGEVRRVEDATGDQLVRSGQWMFCGKEEWKKQRKTQKATETKERHENGDVTEAELKQRGVSDKKIRKARKEAKRKRNQ
jgi:hypothetical protein